MRTITIVKEIFKFEELSDSAKWNVVAWLNECSYDWCDEINASLEEFKRWFNVDVEVRYGYGYWHTTPHCRYEDEDAWNLKGNRLRTWLINNFGDSLLSVPQVFSKSLYSYYGMKEKHHTSRISRVDRYCPFTGVCYDESLLSPMREFIKNPNADMDMYDLVEECLDSFISDLNQEDDYRNSFEYAEEECEANDYEFYENGKVA